MEPLKETQAWQEVGGVIESPNGTTLLRFAWGLGTETNNRAEALALWQGLNQAINSNIQKLVIVRDSSVVIKALIHHSSLQNAKLNNLLDKIHLLLRKLRKFKIYHVLRKLNGRADNEANNGVCLEAKVMHLN